MDCRSGRALRFWRVHRGRRRAINVEAASLEPGLATARQVSQQPDHAAGHLRRLFVPLHPFRLRAAYAPDVLLGGGGGGDVLVFYGARSTVSRHGLVRPRVQGCLSASAWVQPATNFELCALWSSRLGRRPNPHLRLTTRSSGQGLAVGSATSTGRRYFEASSCNFTVRCTRYSERSTARGETTTFPLPDGRLDGWKTVCTPVTGCVSSA